MEYRLYHPGDFAALYAVEELCFQPPIRFSRATMSGFIGNRGTATWIAAEDAQLIAFAIVEWPEDAEGEAAYIVTLETHPDWRRRGIGSELLCRSEQSARDAGAHTIWLHVDAENAVAIQLYESRGYERKGREKNFYSRNRDALVYAKRFTNASGAVSCP